MSEVTSPVSAFAAPYSLTQFECGILDKEEVIEIPCMTMEDWVTCCQMLKANRRTELEAKIKLNSMIAPGEREWMLDKVDNELVTMSFAFTYRTETPSGIASTIKRQLAKGLIAKGFERKEAEQKAAKIVEQIPPLHQRNIALYLADPPRKSVVVDDPSKNVEKASMNETGQSMPQSSENSGGSIQEA